jgi:O-antigen/teichoic acid export membrane protein
LRANGYLTEETDGQALPAPAITGRGSLPRATLLLGASTLAATGLAVIFQVVVSRLLGPSSYGALGALIAVTLIVAIPGLAVQVVVARHTVLRDSAGSDVHELWAGALRLVAALGVCILILVASLSGALRTFFHLESIVPILWLAVFCGVVPAASVLQGILQGRDRFATLATVLIVTAASRFALGYLLAIPFGVSGAVAGAAVGVSLGLLLALRATRPQLWSGGRIEPAVARELTRATLALVALTILVFLDQAVARHFLSRHDSGLYAAGALFAGALFWGSAFVGWAVFPRLVQSSGPEATRILSRTTVIVGVLCLGATAFVTATSGPLLRSLFGPSYAALGASVWLFAAAGTANALLQITLLAAIARRSPSTLAGTIVLAVVVKTTLIATLFHESVEQIATVVLCTSAAVLAIALLGSLRANRAIDRRRVR